MDLLFTLQTVPCVKLWRGHKYQGGIFKDLKGSHQVNVTDQQIFLSEFSSTFSQEDTFHPHVEYFHKNRCPHLPPEKGLGKIICK